VIFGAVVIGRAQKKAPLLLVGIASILIGLGSFGLHGTGTRIGELADVGAMYLISGLGVIFAARRIWALAAPALVGGYIAVVVTSLALMIALHNDGIFMFAGQVAFATIAEIYLYRKGDHFPSYGDQKWMVASFLTAFFIWNLDKWDLLCRPDNHFITGHAVWHALTAVAIYFFAEQQRQIS
jgi:hypothetical protein